VTIAGIGISRIDSVRADHLPANHKDRTVAHARKIAVIGVAMSAFRWLSRANACA
jgi:hypothetical protein